MRFEAFGVGVALLVFPLGAMDMEHKAPTAPEVSSIGGRVLVSDGVFEYERTEPDEGPSGFSVVWRFPDWEKDAWVFMPACAYGGNREWAGIPLGEPAYPPGPSPQGFGPEPRLEMTETVPALAPDGSGVMEVTAGDMSVPCAGVFFPEARRGVLIFTEAQVKGEQIGYIAKAGEIRVDYPAQRSFGYRFNRRSEPAPDRLLTMKGGERIRSRFRRIDFAATNVTEFIERFFRERKCVMSSKRAANGYTPDLWRETESCWNEKLFIDGAYCQERLKWVPGWSAGPQCVYPLYRLGRDPRTRERCRATLDFMCAHQTEAGVFVGCPVGEGRKRPSRRNRQAGDELTQFFRMHADGVWNLLKCIEVVGDNEKWLRAAERGADALVAVWRKHGQFGQWVDSKSLELVVGRSDACAIAPAALVAAYRKFGKREYLDVACASCDDYCRRDLDRGRTYGGIADALMSPDSESAISLLESCMALYEATGDGKWLWRARACAALVSTWVMAYAYEFPTPSELGRLGVNSTGSIFANAQNKHAAPGFATLSGQGLLKLYRATGDAAYLELLADVVSFLPQMVSRADRPIRSGDGRLLDVGFACERVNTSDWQDKDGIGGKIFYASCWCGTSLLATWADVIGEPEMVRVLSEGRWDIGTKWGQTP